MIRLPPIAIVGFLILIFGIGVGLYLSDIMLLAGEIGILITVLAGLCDLNRGA